MHGEFDSAISGSTRKRGRPLGWLFAAVGLFAVLGVGGAALVRTLSRPHEVRRPTARMPESPERAALRLVERLRAHESLLTVRPREGLAFLRGLESADPAEDFLKTLADVQDAGSAAYDRARQSTSGSENDGSLVFGSDDGQVRLRWSRANGGGSLAIEGPDGGARIDLVRTEDGGYLSIDSDDGSVRFDLTRGEDGGQLSIRTDDGETLRLGIGRNAERMPSWVPKVDGIPEPPTPVYSLRTPDGALGAVAWEGDRSIEEILSFYKDRLEDEGYVLDAEHRRRDADLDEGSLWGRDDATGRMVFVTAHRVDGTTKVLLGYGDGGR